MKKIIALAVMVLLSATAAYAGTTVSQTANATLAGVLSIEFANTTDTTFGGGAINWTAIDPSLGTVINCTGHSGTKSDTAVICKYNGTLTAWYLKMGIAGTLATKIKFYMAQPINRNTSTATNGTLAVPTPAAGADWPVIWSSTTTAYTSGTNDTVNTPFGTFVALDYGLNPTGLVSGTAYSGTITYTITTTA